MRCLDERRVAAKAFVHSVETGTGETLPERAVTAVTTLARIDDCADARALSTPMPLPAEPAKRERIEAISKRVAEVEAEAIEANEALAILEPLLADAKDLGWAPLLARVEYDHALRQSRLRNNRQAEIELQEAAVTAEAARVDAVMMDAWIRLVFVVGYQEHRVEEGLLWGRYAQAAIARLGGDDFRQTVLYGYIGVTLLNDETRFEEALTNFERGLEISKRVGPKSAVAHGMGATALALFMMARPAEAASYERRNRAILEEMFGPESIDIAVSLGNEGEELLETGNIDEAMLLLERSRVMQERFGRNDAALLNVIGLALRKKGKLEDALAIDQRSLEMTKKNESPDAYVLSSAEIPVAIDLLALGRAREALPLAEHAVKVRTVTSQSERGEAKFVLAKASFETGDTARALRLAAEAAADYEPTAARYGGRYRVAKEEIEAWQAAHRK
jgi:tetratricopeptide (TPR) repeat protein